MAQQPISRELLGQQFDPVPVSWAENDVQLYALAVGCQPDSALEFVYENRGPKVLPTFAVIPSLPIMTSAVGHVQINLAMLLHGEQAIHLERALPSRFNGEGQATITEVWDKGKAAVLGITSRVANDDGVLFEAHATLFIRGAGGFGGERGPSSAETAVVVPERDADHVIRERTLPQQAALYRLTGDRNPIHIDPQFAQFGGFERPFLHGLCTYGFAGRAALSALCDNDPARLLDFSARFADQVYPGDEIITRLWRIGEGEAVLRAETGEGKVVLNNSRIRFRP